MFKIPNKDFFSSLGIYFSPWPRKAALATKFIQVLLCNIYRKTYNPTDWVGQKVRFGQSNPCILWTMAGRQLLLCKSLRSPSLDSWEDYSHHRLFSVWSGVWQSSLHLDPNSTFTLGSSGSCPPLLWLSLAWDITSSDVSPTMLLTMAAPVFSTVSYTLPPCILHKTSLVARSPPPNLGSRRIDPYLGLSCCFISWSSVLYECKRKI